MSTKPPEDFEGSPGSDLCPDYPDECQCEEFEEEYGPMYTLYQHGKSGDDFNALLEEAKQNIPEALDNWAEFQKHNAKTLGQLANYFKKLGPNNITVCADTHHISFDPTDTRETEFLEMLVLEGFLDKEEF